MVIPWEGWLFMIGIYKITNKINGKIYIGQSNDIQRRFKEHCYKKETPIEKAIHKYGKDNFNFEIIEECPLNQLNERETYWILFYDSVTKGYNCNFGGIQASIGEQNSNSKLQERDVCFIRHCYNQHKKQREIYDTYFSNKITFSYFQNVWQGQSWKNIMPQVFTQENKQYYIYQNSIGSNGAKAKLSDDEVMQIRTRYITESARTIYEDYKDIMKYNTLQQILWGRTYTNLPIYSKKKKQWITN